MIGAPAGLAIARLQPVTDRRPKQALRHYAVGVAIGELMLGASFHGVPSWGLVDNRPFLCCLHGLGISRWRVGARDQAAAIFRRMLWLNPSDN